MLAVRTNLTDILLEVTNEEIRNIATESLSKIRLKGMLFNNTPMDGSLANDSDKWRIINFHKIKHSILVHFFF